MVQTSNNTSHCKKSMFYHCNLYLLSNVFDLFHWWELMTFTSRYPWHFQLLFTIIFGCQLSSTFTFRVTYDFHFQTSLTFSFNVDLHFRCPRQVRLWQWLAPICQTMLQVRHWRLEVARCTRHVYQLPGKSGHPGHHRKTWCVQGCSRL